MDDQPANDSPDEAAISADDKFLAEYGVKRAVYIARELGRRDVDAMNTVVAAVHTLAALLAISLTDEAARDDTVFADIKTRTMEMAGDLMDFHRETRLTNKPENYPNGLG